LQPVLAEAISKNYLSLTQSAADMLPSLQMQQYRQSLLPDRAILSKRMDDALQELPFRSESFEPFLDAVEEAKSLKLLKPDDLRGSSLGAAFDGLLSINESSVSGVIRLTGLVDPAALEELVKESGIPQVAFINLKSSTNELILEFRQEMLSRIGWVAAVILLVLFVGLRDLRRSLKVIVPVILAVLFAAMVPLWLGEPLNLFHLVSLLLVTGLGLDYALFFSSIRDNRGEALFQQYP
jgi:predicted exporter